MDKTEGARRTASTQAKEPVRVFSMPTIREYSTPADIRDTPGLVDDPVLDVAAAIVDGLVGTVRAMFGLSFPDLIGQVCINHAGPGMGRPCRKVEHSEHSGTNASQVRP